MILVDINILVNSYREDMVRHREFRAWFLGLAQNGVAFGVADLVFSGFLRIVTNPAIFNSPTPVKKALKHVAEIQALPTFVPVYPGVRHWEVFRGLVETMDLRGNRIPDAYLAAMAIETGNEWISDDRGFSEYPNLRWRRPLN